MYTHQVQLFEPLSEPFDLLGVEVCGHLHGETRLVPHLGGCGGALTGIETGALLLTAATPATDGRSLLLLLLPLLWLLPLRLLEEKAGE